MPENEQVRSTYVEGASSVLTDDFMRYVESITLHPGADKQAIEEALRCRLYAAFSVVREEALGQASSVIENDFAYCDQAARRKARAVAKTVRNL